MFIVYLLTFNIVMMSGLLIHNYLKMREIKIKSRNLALLHEARTDLTLDLLKREMQKCFFWGCIFGAFLLFFSVSLFSILTS